MMGYSETPLAQKLGLVPGLQMSVLHALKNYEQLVPTFYPAMSHKLGGTLDWVHAFYSSRQMLEQEFAALKQHLAPDGQLWVSWPKKSSGVTSDLDENIVREIGLANGLVDVKVAAVDDTWSGLKFVYRLTDR
jgi:hypothetical protein